MESKLIIFDLDGVLVDSREMHYRSLNKALKSIAPQYQISLSDHLATFDGLSTSKKLEILSSRGLDSNLHREIWNAKQEFTKEIILSHYLPDNRIITILAQLKSRGFQLAVASNSIYDTVKAILLRKGFLEYIDYFASNQCVRRPKPNPEIYFHCMARFGATVENTLIVEDSPIGRLAARRSGAHLLEIVDPDQLNLELILNSFPSSVLLANPQWKGKCNVVIPMAGEGSRFAKAGYLDPKPFIDVKGKPMIQQVVQNLNLDPNCCRFIFIVREQHLTRYWTRYLLNLIAPGCVIVASDGLTEGSTCSVLLASNYLNNDDPLIVANSDQYLEWDANQFMYSMTNVDGGIVTFFGDDSKWSFARVDSQGWVEEVAEKKVISNHATAGIYFWKRGSDYVKYANQMIAKNIRTRGEFYNCPVYNEALADGKKIKIFPAQRMWGLGTPEDLEFYLNNCPD